MNLRRVATAVLGGFLAVLILVPASVVPSTAASGTVDLAKAACTLTDDELVRIWRGWRPDRGGDIIVIPREPNFLGRGYPHSGPWDYVQHVPMLWYGPGYIKARGSVAKTVGSVDIAPTEGAILNYDFPAPDGQVLHAALEPKAKRKDPPKLIVTMVWDAGGRDVLDNHPRAWPYLKSLIPKGTWFENAFVGSAQSDTPPIHATIGTGAYPEHHGAIDQHQRIGGQMVTPWGQGPMELLVPTLADLYDLHMHNKPIVGALATLSAHLGMLGHGALWGGGDKDIAVNRETTVDNGAEGISWNLRDVLKPFYKFPKYVTKLPDYHAWLKETDALDGSLDGAWRGHDFQTDPKVRGGWDSPARIWQQTKLIETVIKREHFGRDNIPDILQLNYKAIDNVGHAYSVDSQEMDDTVKVQDENLKTLVTYLNKHVGEGNWAMVVTADHGSQRDPNVVGAYNIDNTLLEENLNQHFSKGGSPVIQEVRPTQIWVHEGQLEHDGYTTTDISEYIMGLTEDQIPSHDVTPTPGKTMFQAVFPASMMKKLDCMKTALAKEGESIHRNRGIAPSTAGTDSQDSGSGNTADPGSSTDSNKSADEVFGNSG